MHFPTSVWPLQRSAVIRQILLNYIPIRKTVTLDKINFIHKPSGETVRTRKPENFANGIRIPIHKYPSQIRIRILSPNL
jgi:hypothetical protein